MWHTILFEFVMPAKLGDPSCKLSYLRDQFLYLRDFLPYIDPIGSIFAPEQ